MIDNHSSLFKVSSRQIGVEDEVRDHHKLSVRWFKCRQKDDEVEKFEGRKEVSNDDRRRETKLPDLKTLFQTTTVLFNLQTCYSFCTILDTSPTQRIASGRIVSMHEGLQLSMIGMLSYE